MPVLVRNGGSRVGARSVMTYPGGRVKWEILIEMAMMEGDSAARRRIGRMFQLPDEAVLLLISSLAFCKLMLPRNVPNRKRSSAYFVPMAAP